MLFGLPNPIITIGARRKASRSNYAATSNIRSEHTNMVSSGLEPDKRWNPCYSYKNEGPLSIHAGHGYGALFSPIPSMQYPGQTSTQVVHLLEQSGYGLSDCESNSNLGLNMQTPA